MELLDEAERAEIVGEIEEYLKGGEDRQLGEFISVPQKSIGGRVIQGTLAEIMNGRYPYSDLQYRHLAFVEIARTLREGEPYPLLGLDAGESSGEKVIAVLTLFATRHPIDLSPAAQLVRDLGILEENGTRCLVSIAYRCAMDIKFVDFAEYFPSVGSIVFDTFFICLLEGRSLSAY